MNISALLHARAESSPEKTALIDDHRGRLRALTFAELERASTRAAALLHQTGLRPGDGVLIFHPMSAALYIALTAIFRLGLVATFLDPSAGKKHIESSCALYPPKALIASPKAHLLRLISPALRQIPFKFSIGLRVPGAVDWESSERVPPLEDIYPCAPGTPALLTFTSGSTGEPKAALRTHGFLLSQHKMLERSLELKPGEVDLSTLPVFVLANLASGVTTVLPDVDLSRPGSVDPRTLVAQIRTHRPVRAVASPALLECLAEYCLEYGLTVPELKRIFTGGAPVIPRLLAKLQSIAPNAEIVAVYGSTEAEPIAQISYAEMQSEDLASIRSGSGLLAGAPVPEIQLKILPDRWGQAIGAYSRKDFAAACLPSRSAGEIVVSGEHVLRGYLNGRGDEETKFTVEGTAWHRTGDAGYLDGRGRLWLLGRCSARIEDDHGTVYPFTVECVAHHHKGIRRAAAISYWGRRILAVELYDRTAERDLVSLKKALAWAHIDEIQVHGRIPVDTRHNAKIDYPALYRLVDEKRRTAV